MLRGLDALRRFLLEGMHYPDVVAELYAVDDSNGVAAVGNAISNTPEPRPFIGLAMSALPPSAAIVSTARQIDCAPSGKDSKAFRAALTQEMGRVGLVTHHSDVRMLSYLTTLRK